MAIAWKTDSSGQSGRRGAFRELITVEQINGYGYHSQDGSGGIGEKWSGFGCIWKKHAMLMHQTT